MLPTVQINLAKIRANTAFLKSLMSQALLAGVTKGCGGDLKVAAAMLTGGADQLADSRLKRLRCLRQQFPKVPLIMLRQPLKHELVEVVKHNLITVVSCRSVAKALAKVAAEEGKVVSLILMLEVGSLREGLFPHEAVALAKVLKKQPAVKLEGLAVNVGCYQGKMPDCSIWQTLLQVANELKKLGFSLRYLSGGNSSVISFLKTKTVPQEVNHFRVGEAILLGIDTLSNQQVPELAADAFIVEAEVIESKQKNGYYNQVVALGRQEVGFGSLQPLSAGEISIINSDHLVVRSKQLLALTGESLKFIPDYFALMSLMESAYVKKRYIKEDDKAFWDRRYTWLSRARVNG